MMSHAGWRIAVWFASLESTNKPWHTQSSPLAENVAACDQEGPGGLYPGGGVRGGSQQLREPTEDQAASTEVPQHRNKEGAKGGPYSITTKASMLPENHSGRCASQNRVLGSGSARCMKNFVEGCQQALATAKHDVHGVLSCVWRQALTSTKVGQ
ncbi:hypothetical protein NDU88_006090 [Pleurodeles waltl]|uniref:Uncharacterized protein n=1 Tax=Pleurodeles waltl TaxID=8319 RepID=A0AAV7VQC8_PLEWA|nr:hypothetical protein NDU88_006090 [Pleurodeles waltl]